MKNEGKTTTLVEEQTKKIPSITFLNLALASMAVSAVLAITGRKESANFVGQWVPTLLILGTYNKITKTFSAPYSEEQRERHGDNRSSLKSPTAETTSAASRLSPLSAS
ncbi:MAG TPA: hypothetical protein VEY30_07690 [Myxococcaceae bacterium]|nr:hypothetical protein [Myxococcaceae bacterium]